MRKTKIVCTIGPACYDENILREMCISGMNVARLNFSHGSHKEHKKAIDTIKRLRDELGLPIAILLDTKGPEFRIKTFKDKKVMLNKGDCFVFTTEDIVGDSKRVSVNYKELPSDMKKGDTILLSNGLLSFRVDEVTESEVRCIVEDGGELSDKKSMSFPNKVLSREYLSEDDKKDILFGIENGVDFIACSFVSKRQNLIDVNNFLAENGGEKIDVIAKIENRSGVDNIREICEECSGIMIARGDMGVEIPFEELPTIQKSLITTCRLLGKRVITATEMLESMINNPRPTRAEISDVANAVYDGTSAIMLSGETAAGKYPVLTLRTMARIAEKTESGIDYEKMFRNSEFIIKNTADAISHATCGMAIDIGAKVIVASTLSGITARFVSRFRSPIDIIGLTTDERTFRKLALSWAVTPIMTERFTSTDVLFFNAKRIASKAMKLSDGDKIVITGGLTNGASGNTDIIKVESANKLS